MKHFPCRITTLRSVILKREIHKNTKAKTIKQACCFGFSVFVGRAGFEPAKVTQRIYSPSSLAA